MERLEQTFWPTQYVVNSHCSEPALKGMPAVSFNWGTNRLHLRYQNEHNIDPHMHNLQKKSPQESLYSLFCPPETIKFLEEDRLHRHQS